MSTIKVSTTLSSLRRALRISDEDLLQDFLLEIQNQTTINELTRIDCHIERIAAAGGIKMVCSAMADHIENV